MLVRKKTCRLKKKCRLENFPCRKWTRPECPEFPVMQDQKTEEAGKKSPRGKKKGEKLVTGKKKVFFGWKNKMLVGKKKIWLKKKCRLENFPGKNIHVRNVRNSLECKTEKRQRREKKALVPIGEKKREKNSSFGKKKVFVGWKNKMLV